MWHPTVGCNIFQMTHNSITLIWCDHVINECCTKIMIWMPWCLVKFNILSICSCVKCLQIKCLGYWFHALAVDKSMYRAILDEHICIKPQPPFFQCCNTCMHVPEVSSLSKVTVEYKVTHLIWFSEPFEDSLKKKNCLKFMPVSYSKSLMKALTTF